VTTPRTEEQQQKMCFSIALLIAKSSQTSGTTCIQRIRT